MEPWSEVRIGVIGSVDSGKCFGFNTLVKMSNNEVKPIQNILVGDKIIGADNKTYKEVESITIGKSLLYKITQINAIDYLVNIHHILCLKLNDYDTFTRDYLNLVTNILDDNTLNITLEEYLKLPKSIKIKLRTFNSNGTTFKFLISEYREENYFGFSFKRGYKDNRFQLIDGSVVHNSTLTGVLSQDKLDDGRGLARRSILKHPHEKDSGRTSCLVQHYIRGENDPNNVTVLVDLAGHEKYLKTTISGMSKSSLDYACVVVAANMGVLKMTREHLGITLGMNIPFFIVLTKIDIAPNNVKKRTISDIMSLFSRYRSNKKLGIVKTPFILNDESNGIIDFSTQVPIIPISNVTGEQVNFLKRFIDRLKPNIIFVGDKLHFLIECVYAIKGIGFVVSGLVKSGKIQVGNTYFMGPFYGRYVRVLVKSIHNNFRESITQLHKSNTGCVNFKILDKDIPIKRCDIRKGIKFLDEPVLIKTFKAKVKLLHHHTTIKIGYQPVIHCDNISQTATIKKMNTEILRLHETAIIDFEFKYHPEYIDLGSKILFREGKTKGVGEVIDINCLEHH